ncbi:MAG: hypothetical protein NTW04_00180 [Elusimicrobia bacterium]|nr:hypothetical protein [Elusimicrobiota bacterium]
MVEQKISPHYIRFHLYRYQILPISQTIQTQFAPAINSLDELKANKNKFFEEVLKQCKFDKEDKIAQDKLHFIPPDTYVLRLAAQRSLRVNTRSFSEEQVKNWPYCWVVINNNPNVQKIAVQINHKAFTNTKTISDILRGCIEKKLLIYQLRLIIEPMFDIKEFWSMASQNRGKLLQVDFELISPNLSNISNKLLIDLHGLQKSTNTQSTHFQLNSDKTSCLEINQEDKQITSLVNYASEGGGDISLRVRGVNKKIRTKTSVKETTIESFDIEHIKPEEIARVLNKLIND